MRHRLTLTSLLAAAALLAGCGGSTRHPAQHAYHTPYGLEAHSPSFGLPPKGVTLPPSTAAGAPTLPMLDSVDSSLSIFSGLNPAVVAGYTSGSWPTYFDYRGHFSYVVAVMVNTSHFGEHGAAISCLDVEPGDATPSEAGPWLRTEAQHGFRPCAYGSLSEWPAINQSIAGAHVPGHVFRWDADWTYVAHLDNGFDATQWTDHFDGRNIDGSTVTWAFVGKSVTPPPPPTPSCWGRDRHSKTCQRVRRSAYVLGRREARENGYLRVSRANAARLQPKVAPLSRRLRTIYGRASVELANQHYSQLKVSAENGLAVEAKLVPLNARLGPILARVKSEQARAEALHKRRCSLLARYHRAC